VDPVIIAKLINARKKIKLFCQIGMYQREHEAMRLLDAALCMYAELAERVSIASRVWRSFLLSDIIMKIIYC